MKLETNQSENKPFSTKNRKRSNIVPALILATVIAAGVIAGILS